MSMTRTGALLATLGLLLATGPADAQLKPETLSRVELAGQLKPHWVWLNDVSFTHMTDGRAYLLDADSGAFLGMISAGMAHGVLQLAPDGRSFAVPSTYFSRNTRGERTDVVTFYDVATLEPGAEVVIPPKRFMSLPFLSSMPITDDGRFSIIYNFTPEQSVTIVDLQQKKLVGEFATAGCALAYPNGARSFFMQCQDGSLQTVTLEDSGKATLGAVSRPLFDPKDPANEKPVRVGPKSWLFFTFDSRAVLVDASGPAPLVKETWSLLGPGDDGWRLGGLQPVAYHASTGRIFALMHIGARNTHKDPGVEIWVFDVSTHQRLKRFKLDRPASSVAISEDASPLLYTVLFGARDLEVLDPSTGGKLRTIGDLSDEMTVIQPAPVGQAATR